MAAATVTNPCYGYRVTGGTSATTITTTKAWVKSFIFTNNAASDTAAITDGLGNALITIVPDTTIGGTQTQIFVDRPIDGLKVTLSASSSVLIVIIE